LLVFINIFTEKVGKQMLEAQKEKKIPMGLTRRKASFVPKEVSKNNKTRKRFQDNKTSQIKKENWS
jgi:hypothetical protein